MKKKKKVSLSKRIENIEATLRLFVDHHIFIQKTITVLTDRLNKIFDEHSFLIQEGTGQIFRYTPILAQRKDMKHIPALDAIRIIDGKCKPVSEYPRTKRVRRTISKKGRKI